MLPPTATTGNAEAVNSEAEMMRVATLLLMLILFTGPVRSTENIDYSNVDYSKYARPERTRLATCFTDTAMAGGHHLRSGCRRPYVLKNTKYTMMKARITNPRLQTNTLRTVGPRSAPRASCAVSTIWPLSNSAICFLDLCKPDGRPPT